MDGKALRGSSGHGRTQVNLLAAMDRASRAVRAQVNVDAKTNGVIRFQPLLAGLGLAGTVVAANTLPTQRAHAN